MALTPTGESPPEGNPTPEKTIQLKVTNNPVRNFFTVTICFPQTLTMKLKGSLLINGYE